MRGGSWAAGVLAAVLFLAMAGVWTPPGAVMAQEGEAARLDVVESATQDGPAGSTRWDVTIADADDVYGLDIELRFDPATLQVVDAEPDTERIEVTPGDLLSPDFVVENRVNNEQGVVRLALTQVAPSEPVSGDGVLLSLVTTGEGGPPEIASTVLARADGSSQPVTVGVDEQPLTATPGALDVQPTPASTPTPEATADGGAATPDAGTPGAAGTTVDGGDGTQATGTAADGSETAAAEGTAGTTTVPAGSPGADAGNNGDGDGDGGGGGSWTPWLAGAAVVLIAAGVAVVAIQRRRV